MSMHLDGISILDEGRSQIPSTASLPSVWTELTPGASGAPAESHVPALLLVHGGLNQSGGGRRTNLGARS